MRRKRNLPAIFLVNLLLGWSVIGWAVALIWAVSTEIVNVNAGQPSSATPPLSSSCFRCGRSTQPRVRFCANCGAALA
jgi:hypothetical protein